MYKTIATLFWSNEGYIQNFFLDIILSTCLYEYCGNRKRIPVIVALWI